MLPIMEVSTAIKNKIHMVSSFNQTNRPLAVQSFKLKMNSEIISSGICTTNQRQLTILLYVFNMKDNIMLSFCIISATLMTIRYSIP